ncbi:helix-turn-helix domain-containing protein [Spirillospora sp. CA-253888]
MATRQPTQQTRAFGAEVARLRQEAGITRTELAARTSVTSSYIAQVERGVTRCRRDFAARMDSALGTGTDLVETWDSLLKSSKYPKFFADYPRAEASAVLLRAYEENYVMGLFQIEEYIRALQIPDDMFEGRLHRQAVVLGRGQPPTIAVVLSETVLLRPVGGTDVMRKQCEHLLKVSEWENVTLQVAPIAYYRRVSGSFNLATQDDGQDLVYLETTPGGITSSEPADILHVEKAFTTLQARALDVSASQQEIRRVIDERWT